MLQHKPFQNIKTDGNEFKMFYEKDCNILCALVCLSDLQLSWEIFHVSESQCELISIYCIKTFCLSKTLEKMLRKSFFFPCTYNGAERQVTCERYENAADVTNHVILTSRITFATVPVTYDDVSFCDGPGILNGKAVY